VYLLKDFLIKVWEMKEKRATMKSQVKHLNASEPFIEVFD
jgi:hypothetical protein